jgi:hypothetical protein
MVMVVIKYQALHLKWSRASTNHQTMTKITMTEARIPSPPPSPLKGEGEGRFGHFGFGYWNLAEEMGSL